MPLGRPVVPDEYCSRSPSPFVVDRGVRFARNAFGVALPALEIVVRDQQQLGQAARQVLAQVFAGLAQRRRPDDRLGGAVVDDVGGLGRGQVGVYRHVVQTAAPRRPHDGMHVFVVLHEDRDGVALGQARPPEVVRQPVGPRLQLIEGDDRAGRVKNDCGLTCAEVLANLHAQTVPPKNLTGVKWSRVSRIGRAGDRRMGHCEVNRYKIPSLDAGPDQGCCPGAARRAARVRHRRPPGMYAEKRTTPDSRRAG